MKILVTGGAGYLGTQLISKLVKRNDIDEIVIYDNLSRKNHNLFLGRPIQNAEKDHQVKLTFVPGELLDTRKLKDILQDIDVVYHLAAKVLIPFINTDGHYYEQVNNWGTAELVYAVEESNVKKFIYTSSTSVYGEDHVNEESKPAPQTFYGISKYRGEQHVNRLAKKMDAYIIRSGNVYGYNKSMRFDAVINRFMFNANFTNRISINGTGKQARAFVHVATVAETLSQIISLDVPSGTYNLVEKNYQILDIVDVVKAIYPKLEFVFINQHMDLRNLTVDTNLTLDKYLKKDQFEKPFGQPLEEELEEFKEQFSF